MDPVLNTIKVKDQHERMRRESDRLRHAAQNGRPASGGSERPADPVADRAAYLARLLGRPRTTHAARVDIPGG